MTVPGPGEPVACSIIGWEERDGTSRRGLDAVRRVSVPAVLPGFVVIVAGLIVAMFDGGFRVTIWYPTALFLLALLVSIAVAAPPARDDRSRLVELALVLYGLFAVWAFLSIIWASAPGPAWDGANRILLYGIVLSVVCLRPWSAAQGAAALVLVAFGTAAIAIGVLVIGTTTSDPARLFLEGRLAVPAGYLNATANLWLIGFFPALYVAAARQLAWPLRGLGLSAATILLQVALLSQSRGAAIAFVVTVVLYLVLTPGRWGALLTLATAVGLTVLASGPLLDVRLSAEVTELGPALDQAARAIALSAGAALVLGCVAGLVAGRTRAIVDARPRVRRAGDVALAGAAVAALVIVLSTLGNPVDFAEARWSDFRDSGYSDVDSGRTRFGGSLGSGRYDFYRVALAEFRAHPVRGTGADNFAAAYLQDRRTPEAPQYPHSLVFLLLSQLGAVGTALLAAFLALMVVAAGRVLRRGSREQGAVVAAALAGAGVWLVHAAGDWLWEFPALGILGMSLLGIAARTRSEPTDPGRSDTSAAAMPVERGHPRSGSSVLLARVAAAVIVLAAAVSLAVPGVAARYATAAYDYAGTDPSRTLSGLERAASVNRLDDEPLVTMGVIAQRLGRSELAVDSLRRAIERSPENWYAHLELGLALAVDGDVEAAQRSLRVAVALNPRQTEARQALRAVLRGEALDPEVVQRSLRGELDARFNRTDPSEAAGDGDR